ncbi:MAG: hypothetical protein PHP02_08255, partial [Eubacteriales bacterium]|nr:hypothetical protein [Eubacteriales bacterium]
ETGGQGNVLRQGLLIRAHCLTPGPARGYFLGDRRLDSEELIHPDTWTDDAVQKAIKARQSQKIFLEHCRKSAKKSEKGLALFLRFTYNIQAVCLFGMKR